MLTIENIDVLCAKLEELQQTQIQLETHYEELKKIHAEGKFVPDELVESIRIYLAAMCINQQSIYETFEDFDIGDVPETTDEMLELLEVCRAELEAEHEEKSRASIYVPENPDLLYDEVSVLEDEPISLVQFKVDMGRQLLGRKLECMVEALESGGYTVEGIAAMKHGRQSEVAGATSKLYTGGYLKRYSVEGMGDYYCLSARGARAFHDQGILNFMNHYMKYHVSPDHLDSLEEEMTTNKAMTRLLAYETYSRQKLYVPGYRFQVKYVGKGENYFIQGYPDRRSSKTTWFTGIVTEHEAQFEELSGVLSENYKTGDRIIVVGVTAGQAKETARWIKQGLGIKTKAGSIYYCYYQDMNVNEI